MKKKQIVSATTEKKEMETKKYTIEELLRLGSRTNKIEIAPNLLKKQTEKEMRK